MTLRRPCLALILVLALGAVPGAVPAGAEPGALLGIYPQTGLQSPGAIDSIAEIDTWLAPTGRRISIAGTWMDIEAPWDVPGELDAAWDRGYVPFVNLALWRPIGSITNGSFDAAIRTWAQRYAIWTHGHKKKAFLALLQEMNGYWVPYTGNPPAYVAAWRRIRQIFEEELAAAGVPSTAISWVFAPNGWPGPTNSDPLEFAKNRFENYYPGGDVVDVVS